MACEAGTVSLRIFAQTVGDDIYHVPMLLWLVRTNIDHGQHHLAWSYVSAGHPWPVSLLPSVSPYLGVQNIPSSPSSRSYSHEAEIDGDDHIPITPHDAPVPSEVSSGRVGPNRVSSQVQAIN